MSTAMSAEPRKPDILAQGYAEKKAWMERAHTDLRTKGVSSIREKGGTEYRITEEVVQIVLKDGRMVQYHLATGSIFITQGNENIPFDEAQRLASSAQMDLSEVNGAISRLASLSEVIEKRKDLEVHYQPNYTIPMETRYNAGRVTGTGTAV